MSDLLLILDRDPTSLSILRGIASHLGCERIEADTATSLNDILAIRTPTLAVLALDATDADGLSAIRLLSDHHMKPATFLIGSSAPRVLESARRAARARGLNVIGTSARPLDAPALERMLGAHMTTAPAIARGELDKALAGDELSLLYQPKFALHDGTATIQGVEALVRWQHPRRGALRPTQFLGAIEQYGLMSALTDFVMTEAIRQAGQWRIQGLTLETVINLSPALVRDPEFPRRLCSLLREHDVPPEQLVLDITEPSSLEDRNLMLEVFTSLRMLGIGLSLDNFGTGQSSLTELYRLPYSEIKVDQSLLIDGPSDADAQRIVHAVVELGHALRMCVCAQGVESLAMSDFARAVGFDSAQGHYFCAPVEAGHIERLAMPSPRLVASAPEGFGPPRPAPDQSFLAGMVRAAKREGAC